MKIKTILFGIIMFLFGFLSCADGQESTLFLRVPEKRNDVAPVYKDFFYAENETGIYKVLWDKASSLDGGDDVIVITKEKSLKSEICNLFSNIKEVNARKVIEVIVIEPYEPSLRIIA